MQVPLRAYAEDCSFTGELTLSGDRLSDFLSTTAEFPVLNLDCRALDDGRVVPALFVSIQRDDLCLVVAGEPRGREELRVYTRQFPVVVQAGPYQVRGYVHAPPTLDPFKLPGRRAVVPVTSASVRYTEAGSEVEFEAETVLVNSAWIGALEPATATDVELVEHAAEDEVIELSAADLAARLGDAPA
jgi:hypothetical protein